MTLYDFGNWLNIASFYMIGGTGAAISMKCGEFNLGGEGQIYAGGFTAAIFLAKLHGLVATAGAASLELSLAVPLAVILAVAGGMTISALLCFFSALLRKYRGASFLLTSFIVSSAVIPLINGLIAGPFRGNTGNLLATPFIDKAFRFKKILPPSSLNISFFIGILICVAGGFFLFKTRLGKKICIFGISREFALYSGFSEKSITFTSALTGGALHGLCGSFIVLGTYYTCHSGFYLGHGWTCLSAAMLAGSNPFLVIFSSLFLGAVTAFTNSFALHHNVGYDLSTIIQAVIMIAVSIPFYSLFKAKKRLRGQK